MISLNSVKRLNGQQDVITDSQSTYHPENTSGPYPQSDPSARYSPQLNALNTNAFDGTDGAGQIDPTAYPQAFHGLEWSVLLGCYVQSTDVEAPTQQEETMVRYASTPVPLSRYDPKPNFRTLDGLWMRPTGATTTTSYSRPRARSPNL